MLSARAFARALGAGGILLGLGACENLYIASDTNVGLQASVNAAQTSGELSLGWERTFIVLVPKSVEIPSTHTPTKPNHEAMSVASCTNLETDGIYLTSFEQKLATGVAAKTLMENMRTHGEQKTLFRMGCFVANSDDGGE